MAKLMKHRTDNDIKNKWYSMIRKEKRAEKRPSAGVLTEEEPSAEGSAGMEHFEDADSMYVDIMPKDWAATPFEANDTRTKVLPDYVPHAPYHWTSNNPFGGQNVATYVDPKPLFGDGGAFVLVPNSTSGQSCSSSPREGAMAGGHSFGSNVFQSHAYEPLPAQQYFRSKPPPKEQVTITAHVPGGYVAKGPPINLRSPLLDLDTDGDINQSSPPNGYDLPSFTFPACEATRARMDPPGRGEKADCIPDSAPSSFHK